MQIYEPSGTFKKTYHHPHVQLGTLQSKPIQYCHNHFTVKKLNYQLSRNVNKNKNLIYIYGNAALVDWVRLHSVNI